MARRIGRGWQFTTTPVRVSTFSRIPQSALAALSLLLVAISCGASRRCAAIAGG